MQAANGRVLVLYTGGTIGMRSGPRGYEPVPGFLREQLARLPQFHDPFQPPLTTPSGRYDRRVHFEIIEHDPLLDSSSMSVENWVRIGLDIEAHYDDFDGFVVLHGTDTMAYTASALSFMLGSLGKPVVLTGSQIPLSELRNDAIDNVLDALVFAGLFAIPEVTVFFHHQLFRGNRCRKVDAQSFDAFRSPNFPALATVGVDVEVAWHRVLPKPKAPLNVLPFRPRHVAALRLFPGMSGALLSRFLGEGMQGLVLETYGSGNGPDRPDLLRALREASDTGVVIVNVSQCARATVKPSYAAGQALTEAGVVSGRDMTAEAALTKLSWLASQDLSAEAMRRRMTEDLRGELTPPSQRNELDPPAGRPT
jgi:L-asparaginase type I